MAHEITNDDNMVSANGIVPWHGLGVQFSGRPTAVEAAEAAKLNWGVELIDVFTPDTRKILSHRATMRTDSNQILGVVSNTWEPFQNSQLLDIAESLGQVPGIDFQPVIETAGSLKGGRVVWVLVKVGQRSFASSEHLSYLLLSNGHDGTRAVRATMTDTRVVCANTLNYAEGDGSVFYVSHAKGIQERMQKAVKAVGWANAQTDMIFKAYEALVKVPMSLGQAHGNFIRLMLDDKKEKLTKGGEERVDALLHLFRHGQGNEGRTAFDFLNAVTDFVDHQSKYHRSEGIEERRFMSTTFGVGASLKREALKVAQKYALAA